MGEFADFELDRLLNEWLDDDCPNEDPDSPAFARVPSPRAVGRTIAVYAISQNIGSCDGCRRPVLWCWTYPRKKRIPMEVDSIALRTFEARNSNHNEIQLHDAAKVHFATCRFAKRFRKRPA
jgi:hypothetical protein